MLQKYLPGIVRTLCQNSTIGAHTFQPLMNHQFLLQTDGSEAAGLRSSDLHSLTLFQLQILAGLSNQRHHVAFVHFSYIFAL
jgi:hypothetical protein